MLNLCEQVMAQVCADFDATPAEFNAEEDDVHLLVQYPPKVALSHLVNSLKGVSSRRCTRNSLATELRCAAGSGPRHTLPDHGTAHHYPPSRTTLPTKTTRLGKVFSCLEGQGFHPGTGECCHDGHCFGHCRVG